MLSFGNNRVNGLEASRNARGWRNPDQVATCPRNVGSASPRILYTPRIGVRSAADYQRRLADLKLQRREKEIGNLP